MATTERPLRRSEWGALAVLVVLALGVLGLAGQDYRAMWLVCATAILASIPFTRRLRKAGEGASRPAG